MQDLLSLLSIPVAVVIFILTLIYLYESGLLRVLFWGKQAAKSPDLKFPYRKKEYLFSIAERRFYDVLDQVAQKMGCVVFAKVRLEDLLLDLPSGTRDSFGLRNRVKSRHIDFVLCDKQYVRLLLAIELDDSSHQREDRMRRDVTVNKILRDAGLPILHVPVQEFYDQSWLSSEIAKFTAHS